MAPSPSGFEAVVGALFARLGLEAPRFDATGIVRLRVDDQGVNLSGDGRGHVLVEAVAGRVPDDAPARRRWRDRHLHLVPALLLVSESGSFLRRQGRNTVLVVQARMPLRLRSAEALERLIEDVLTQAERQRALLDEAPRPAAAATGPAGETESEVMIFRL